MILLIVGFLVIVNLSSRARPEADRKTQLALMRRALEVQGQYLLGMTELPGVKSSELLDQARSLNSGPVESRFCFVVLAGELGGPEEALKQLDKLDEQLRKKRKQLDEQQAAVRRALRRLYRDYARQRWDAPSLSAADRQLLVEHLGWFGSLALAPRDGADAAARQQVLAPARRTMWLLMAAMAMMLLVGVVGLVLLVVMSVLAMLGVLRSAIRTGVPHGDVYAETFALWLLLFVVLSLAGAAMSQGRGNLLASFVVSASSLLALAWPLVRGVSWRQVADDVGLTGWQRVPVEMFWGFVSYLASLPLLVIAVLIVLVLAQVAGMFSLQEPADEFSLPPVPQHPLPNWIAEGGWPARLQVLLLAAVVAPIVEELFFRGVLYRHLRERTARWRVAASVVFSAGVSSLIFAVIHPQGLIAVPALGLLAFVFALVREWRGSIFAPITMHAINNGLVTLVMFALL